MISITSVYLSNIYRRVKRLFALATTDATEELHYIQQPLEEWYSEDGKVVLLGDAVHAACVRRVSTTRLLQLDSDFIFPVASLHRLIPERWPLRTQQHSGASCLA